MTLWGKNENWRRMCEALANRKQLAVEEEHGWEKTLFEMDGIHTHAVFP